MNWDKIDGRIAETVHEEYYRRDTNCATVTLLCLAEIYGVELTPQVIAAAQGMHGAGGYRAQCGLVEGGLMFLGIYGAQRGLGREEVISLCRQYAQRFEETFGDLRCRVLRPGGFRADDPPHLCEGLTRRAVGLTARFAAETIGEGKTE